MRKTFCDKCGRQCVNLTVHLNGAVVHSTASGEHVGTDEIRTVELCSLCYAPVREMLNLTEIPSDSYPQDSVAEAVPVRG